MWVTDQNAALLTDLYELTMAQAYWASGVTGPASFELFVRHLPRERNFLVACGIEDALGYVEHLRFDGDALDWLGSLGIFDPGFLDVLSGLRFHGTVHAVNEGELVYGGEPILRVTGPMIEAQVVESFLINCVAFQTLVASQAARLWLACAGRPFVDFSLRRDHGADAALKAARAAYVGGAAATSNLLASRLYGLELSGTMAHSYVMAFADEAEAFEVFARQFPGRSVLLIDTWDTARGALRAAEVARRLEAEGTPVWGVRIDSGDFVYDSLQTRAALDHAGMSGLKIFLSGDLDEYRIESILAAGAPVDGFGVGTRLGTGGDAPSLGAVYKLVESEHLPRLKLSAGKASLPGRKQVYRFGDHDLIALDGEAIRRGRPLLHLALVGRQRTAPIAPLGEAHLRCLSSVSALPPRLRSLQPAEPPYPVVLSPALRRLTDTLSARATAGSETREARSQPPGL